jgi:4-amino-4-deoxy-L-arabinose transferase-like glycosyltransferase
MLMAFKRSESDTPYQKLIKKGMMILFWTVLIIFTIVNTKIVHYSSPCYLPLTYLACYSIFKLMDGEYKMRKLFSRIYILISILIGIAFVAIGLVDSVKEKLIAADLIKDKFAVENLKAEVHWQGWEWLLGLFFMGASLLAYQMFRKGKPQWLFYLYSSYIVFIVSAINTLTPKIEQYSQDVAIRFYKSVSDKDFYVETVGFKSYAYLFYAKKRPEQNLNPDCMAYVERTLNDLEADGHSRITSYSLAYQSWMQYGKIDRPAIFVTKKHELEILTRNAEIKPFYEKNGFVFCVRMPKKEHIKS